MKSISFFIPAYNCSETISEAVDSIMETNFAAGDELVIVNDCSTDDTAKTLKKLRDKYPVILTIDHKRNKGGDYSHTVARDDLVLEIKALFEAQRVLSNAYADTNFEADYTNIFASQRPVDDGQIFDMVGDCTFEIGEKRAAKATYSAERFVLLSRLNNLMLIDAGERRALDKEQRKIIETMAYKSAKVKYQQVRKALDEISSGRADRRNFGTRLHRPEHADRRCGRALPR